MFDGTITVTQEEKSVAIEVSEVDISFGTIVHHESITVNRTTR